MATYSTSKRLLSAYKHCRGYYGGMGPVERIPTRLRVSMSRPGKYWRSILMHLDVVESKPDPKRLKYWRNRWKAS